ncbi:MAG TPA: hypothetical protein VFG05_01935 [Methylocella sp.]|nr:hypothetical protein [Methylocella sp.]
MTVAQLIDELSRMPAEAVVLLDGGAGLSAVSGLDFIAGQGPSAPPEVILLPNMEE